MKKKADKKDRVDSIIERNPAFKLKIEKADAEYKARGGISLDALMRKLAKKIVKERN